MRGRHALVRSHVGLVRSHNEDSWAVSGAEVLLSRADEVVVEWEGTLNCDGGWALLADGLGGHAAGEIASYLALEVMRPLMPSCRTETDIDEAIASADAALFMAMEMKPALRGMGTTVAGILLRGTSIIAFNVGDSRIYSFLDGELTQLSTEDVDRNGRLTQCLGGVQEPAPLLVRFSPVDSQAAVLLCSDGLTDMLSDDEVARVLSIGEADPTAALVDAALQAGGHDNITVIFISGDPSQVADR